MSMQPIIRSCIISLTSHPPLFVSLLSSPGGNLGGVSQIYKNTQNFFSRNTYKSKFGGLIYYMYKRHDLLYIKYMSSPFSELYDQIQ